MTAKKEAPAEGAGETLDALADRLELEATEDMALGGQRSDLADAALEVAAALRNRTSEPEAGAVAWRMIGPGGGLIGMRSEPYHSGFERMMKADVGCVVQPLFTHPAPATADKLKVAVEALEKVEATCRENLHSLEALMSQPPQNAVAYHVGNITRQALATLKEQPDR